MVYAIQARMRAHRGNKKAGPPAFLLPGFHLIWALLGWNWHRHSPCEIKRLG